MKDKKVKYVVRCFNDDSYLSDNGDFYAKSYAKKFNTLEEALGAKHNYNWEMSVVIETIYKI